MTAVTSIARGDS